MPARPADDRDPPAPRRTRAPFDPERMAVAPDPRVLPVHLTVSQLNALVKRTLTTALPATIHLVGEISNFRRADSGHLYMTIKDERSEVRAVMWRSLARSLKFKPADGLAVVATGSVDLYELRGEYQFNIRRLEPVGTGALELAFQQLCARLRDEGLFDIRRKKPIPRFPRRIAVVTSATGAAIRDILRTLHRRCPCVEVLLHPVAVQGEGAAAEIAAALRRLNEQAARLGGLDLIIVGRGGGSLEDLWAFNEEVVARAIGASAIPVISGVGHESDTTIADLVADLRAATPTAAAELAVPVLGDLLDDLGARAAGLLCGMRHRLEVAAGRIEAVACRPCFRDPMSIVRRSGQAADEVSGRLELAWSRRWNRVVARLHDLQTRLLARRPAWVLHRRSMRLAEIGHRLDWRMHDRLIRAAGALERCGGMLRLRSPLRAVREGHNRLADAARGVDRAVVRRLESSAALLEAVGKRLESTEIRRTLARGYTITRRATDGRIVRRPGDVGPGDVVRTETAEGTFESRVTDDGSG